MLHLPWAASSVWIAVLALVKSNVLIFNLFQKVSQGGCGCIWTLLYRLSEHEIFLVEAAGHKQQPMSVPVYDLDWKLNNLWLGPLFRLFMKFWVMEATNE